MSRLLNSVYAPFILIAILTILPFNISYTASGDQPKDINENLISKNSIYFQLARIDRITDQPVRRIVTPQALTIIGDDPVDFVSGSKAGYTWRVHPALSREPGGKLLRGYEYYEDIGNPNPIAWQSSSDDGLTWSTPCHFSLFGSSITGWYPSVDYRGNGTRMLGTQVITSSFFYGGGIVLFDFGDPTDPLTWSGYWSDYSDNGWYDMRMCEIACDNSQQNWNWGMISTIMSGIYPFASTDAPHIYSQLDELGHMQLSSYPNFPGCATTAADIDHITSRTYAVYDRFDTDDDQWQLFIRKDDFSNWYNPTSAASLYYSDSEIHLRYPALAAHGDTVVIIAQSYSESSAGNTDIVCWGTDNGVLADIAFLSTIASGLDAENHPELSHRGGDDFICTFYKNSELYASLSSDGGHGWSTPFRVSSGFEPVVDDYRTDDICDGGVFVMWEYESGDDILLAMATLDCLDGDNDGICDDADNCPVVANSAQDDQDGDGIGDLCDNCQLTANSDQADADHDDIGDLCDPCTDTDGDGFGNPGYPNSCPPDNCPFCFNLDQADSNGDGIGNACDTYICGDANNDTGINVGDAVYILNYIFHEGIEPNPLKSGDANNDDNVNIGDAVFLINHVFNDGPEPCSK